MDMAKTDGKEKKKKVGGKKEGDVRMRGPNRTNPQSSASSSSCFPQEKSPH